MVLRTVCMHSGSLGVVLSLQLLYIYNHGGAVLEFPTLVPPLEPAMAMFGTASPAAGSSPLPYCDAESSGDTVAVLHPVPVSPWSQLYIRSLGIASQYKYKLLDLHTG
eukprot:scpid92955/ scgid25227/ 